MAAIRDLGGSKELYEERRAKKREAEDAPALELEVLDGLTVALIETVFDDGTQDDNSSRE